MLQINEISDDYIQQLTPELENGETFTFNLSYIEAQQAWFADVTYNNTIINGIRLVYSANLLQQYKNIIPFGLQVISADVLDPDSLDSFSSGAVEIFILNETEVQEVDNLFVTP